MTENRHPFSFHHPAGQTPLDSQAIHLPPLTARSRNLVRFARHLPIETMDESFAGDYSFRDAGSRFSVLKSPKTLPGPDECYGLFARDVRPLFRKLLGLELGYPGLDAAREAKLCGYNAMNYYRSHVVEYFCHNGIEPMPPVEGDCVLWFAAADVLRIRYRLWNKGASDVEVRLAWRSEGEPGDGGHAEVTECGWRFTARQHVGLEAYSHRCELLAEEEGLVFHADGDTIGSAPVNRTLPPGGVATFSFAARFAFNDEAFPDWPADLREDQSLARAIAEAERGYETVGPIMAALPHHGDLVLKAVGTLRSLRYLDTDPQGKPVMTIHAGKTGCGATWFWDSGVTLPALGLMQEREAGSGVLRLLTRGIDDTGRPAVTYENQTYCDYGYQMPILAWGAGHYLAQTGDADLLTEHYGPLARYVRHWLDNFRTPWGLVIHPAGCSCLDDALRWHSGLPFANRPRQPWFEQDWGHMSPTAFAAPDINAFLVLECRTLAVMAGQLGKHDEATAWLSQADALSAAINQHLLEPETRTYQDRNIESGAFTGIVNLASFIPVYAGIAPSEIATHMCRDYLLSPEHFLTDLPFPVIDRAHPTFRPGGFLHAPPEHPGCLVQHSYWRGRTWIHGNNWYLGALWQSGFQQQADELADRILTAVSRSEGINECYDSLTGFPNGHPEFMWSSAAVLMMVHGFYRRQPIAWGNAPVAANDAP
jgi:hypothetical protein